MITVRKCPREPGSNNEAALHCGVFIIARMATIGGEWFPFR